MDINRRKKMLDGIRCVLNLELGEKWLASIFEDDDTSASLSDAQYNMIEKGLLGEIGDCIDEVLQQEEAG